VTVASQISLTTGSSSPEVVHARDFVERVIDLARPAGVAARGLVEVARSVEDGFLAAADSHAPGMILVGYSDEQLDDDTTPGDEGRLDRIIHRVARKAHADGVAAKFRRDSHRRIVAPVADGAPLELTRILCASLSAEAATKVTFLHVVEPGASVAEARHSLSAQLEEAGMLDLGELEVRTADVLVDDVVTAVGDDDLVILTPSDRPGLLERVYSSRAEKIAEAVSASVVLAWRGRAAG
jgi:hypothetical protein